MTKDKIIYNQLYTLDCIDKDHLRFHPAIIRKLKELIISYISPSITTKWNAIFLEIFKDTEFARCLRDRKWSNAARRGQRLIYQRKFGSGDFEHGRMLVETLIHHYRNITEWGTKMEKDHLLSNSGVCSERIKAYIVRALDYGNEFSNIEWQWKSSRGTFIKRLSSSLYNNFNKFILTETQIIEINNIIKAVKLNSPVYHFDFDRSYTWNAGDFEDGGSCFWDSRENARVIMRDDKRFQALRLFNRNEKTPGSKELILPNKSYRNYPKKFYYENENECFTGAARCWLVQERVNVDSSLPKLQGEHDIYILFNAYGKPLEELANLFSMFLSNPLFASRVVSAGNGGQTGGTLFVNSGQAVMIGREDLISHVTYYDFSALEKEYVDASTYKPASFILFDTSAIGNNTPTATAAKALSAKKAERFRPKLKYKSPVVIRGAVDNMLRRAIVQERLRVLQETVELAAGIRQLEAGGILDLIPAEHFVFNVENPNPLN